MYITHGEHPGDVPFSSSHLKAPDPTGNWHKWSNRPTGRYWLAGNKFSPNQGEKRVRRRTLFCPDGSYSPGRLFARLSYCFGENPCCLTIMDGTSYFRISH